MDKKNKEISVPKKRGRKKKDKTDPVVKIKTDFEIEFKSFEKKPGDKYDMSFLKSPYFSKLPDHLVVTPETPIETKLWSARDISQGHKKEVYFLRRHIVSKNESVVEATDMENVKKIFPYDAICIVPATHKSSQKISLDQALELVQEKKRIANINRKKKEKK